MLMNDDSLDERQASTNNQALIPVASDHIQYRTLLSTDTSSLLAIPLTTRSSGSHS